MDMEGADTLAPDSTTWQDELGDLNPENSALARLQRDLVAGSTTDQVITSYDRMHHRHSRS